MFALQVVDDGNTRPLGELLRIFLISLCATLLRAGKIHISCQNFAYTIAFKVIYINK